MGCASSAVAAAAALPGARKRSITIVVVPDPRTSQVEKLTLSSSPTASSASARGDSAAAAKPSDAQAQPQAPPAQPGSPSSRHRRKESLTVEMASEIIARENQYKDCLRAATLELLGRISLVATSSAGVVEATQGVASCSRNGGILGSSWLTEMMARNLELEGRPESFASLPGITELLSAAAHASWRHNVPLRKIVEESVQAADETRAALSEAIKTLEAHGQQYALEVSVMQEIVRGLRIVFQDLDPVDPEKLFRNIDRFTSAS